MLELRERRQATVKDLASRQIGERGFDGNRSTCRLRERDTRSALSTGRVTERISEVDQEARRDRQCKLGPVGNERHNPYLVSRTGGGRPSPPNNAVHDEHHRLYPLQYAIDNRRIANETESEERGLRRPPTNKLRISSHTRAFRDGNWDAVVEHDLDEQWRSAVAGNSRQLKKNPRRELIEYVCRMGYGRRLNPDPHSDDDDGAPIS